MPPLCKNRASAVIRLKEVCCYVGISRGCDAFGGVPLGAVSAQRRNILPIVEAVVTELASASTPMRD